MRARARERLLNLELSNMKPNIEEFRRVSEALMGNISKIAYYFDVDRRSVYRWLSNEGYREAIEDSRGAFFDECMQMARLVALGVPELDENGKFKGWKVRPDSRMLRYLISTLGKDEGFGKNIEPETNRNDLPAARVLTKSEYVEIMGENAYPKPPRA